mmetsp:Transcript_47709/g.102227  ORF Transcript_47709/g.102227 Transcript_47709/m.102227 type:complete len:444 (+) Transcript_47709:88-1419(+)
MAASLETKSLTATANNLVLDKVPGMRIILDGRCAVAHPGQKGSWTLDEHGFTFLSDSKTSVPMTTFLTPAPARSILFRFSGTSAVPADPATVAASWTCTYYKEIAELCKSLLPEAEAVHLNYHVLRHADMKFKPGELKEIADSAALEKESEARFRVPPLDPASPAHRSVSQILATLQYVSVFPADYLHKAGTQLHLEGEGGVEAYLAQLVQLTMPEASPGLQAEVLSLMRDDTKYYSFVSVARQYIPKPNAQRRDKVHFEPPAVGGAHTDVSAESYLSQFRDVFPEGHAFGTPAPGRQRRVVFLKFWRNIADSPIVNHHLAILDKSSLADSDIHEVDFSFKGIRIKQNRLNANIDLDKLQWVYFPRMQRDEVICFQQGDVTLHGPGLNGTPPKATFPKFRQDHATFHGAFLDPMPPSNAAPRQSIEAAAYVFLPEEPEITARL